MANLPPTRYLDAGPGTPQANPNVAAAQAHAYANLGNTIAQIGEQGMQYAARLKSIEDTGTLAGIFARMEKDASDFSISLMTREDSSNWPQEWQKRADTWRQEAKKQKLSPAAQAKFEEKFLDWNTRRSIQFETQAATKGIEIARGKVANAYQFHLENQNYEGARETLRMAHEGGLADSVAMEKGLMDIDKTERHDGVLADIDDDPAGWIDMHQKPLPGYDMASWNRLRSHASGVERDRTYAVAAKIQDKIVTGDLATEDDVKKDAAGLRPTEVLKLQEFRERWQAAEMNDLINSPEHQAQVLGEFDRLLADYVPITGDSPDMPAVELGALMKLVPEGPLREDMDRRLQAVAANQKAEAQNNLDLMLDQVTAAAKSGKLGKVSTPEVFDTDRAITRGFLTGTEGLQSLGFSKKEAAAIASADNDFERQKLFRESWKTREGSDENATPWARAAAGAILDRSGTFTVEPAPDDFTVAGQQAEIDLKVGQIRAGMTEWARLNPELARDPEKIRAELHKRTGMELRKPVRRIAPPPGKVPTETSLNTPGVNPNVDPLYRTVSAKFPSVQNWGIWGDDKHKMRKSDHNTGDAIDIAIKDNDGTAVADLVASNAETHNVKYLIHNGRIWKPTTGWQPYTGKDKHSGHVHVSFHRKDTSMASN